MEREAARWWIAAGEARSRIIVGSSGEVGSSNAVGCCWWVVKQQDGG